MVYHNTIPFGAPSQLRLQVAADAEGRAMIAVLDPFDKPLGDLKNLETSVEAIKALLSENHAPILAKNKEAFIEIKAGHDAHHVTFDIHYEDPDRWTKGDNTLEIEDVTELVEGLKQATN